jgi:hypothetical protein
MRHHLFNAWCVICLLVTAVLLAGYVLDMSFIVWRGSVAGGTVRDIELVTGRGRLRCFLSCSATTVPPAQAGFHTRAQVRLIMPRFDVTGFDSHWIYRPGSAAGRSLYLVSCPLWFAMIVALVSPAIWLINRRRRQRRLHRAEGSAFAVVQAAAASGTTAAA